jgi:hypothetical protein
MHLDKSIRSIIGKEKAKLSILQNDVVYLENPWESSIKLKLKALGR